MRLVESFVELAAKPRGLLVALTLLGGGVTVGLAMTGFTSLPRRTAALESGQDSLSAALVSVSRDVTVMRQSSEMLVCLQIAERQRSEWRVCLLTPPPPERARR